MTDLVVAESRARQCAGGFLFAYQGASLEAYRRDLTQWFDWCATFDTDPLAATRPLLQAWIASLWEQKRAAATVARKVSVVARFYGYAADEE